MTIVPIHEKAEAKLVTGLVWPSDWEKYDRSGGCEKYFHEVFKGPILTEGFHDLPIDSILITRIPSVHSFSFNECFIYGCYIVGSEKFSEPPGASKNTIPTEQKGVFYTETENGKVYFFYRGLEQRFAIHVANQLHLKMAQEHIRGLDDGRRG